MKNIIKKNQVIIFTISLMLIVAGYMNYTINTEDTLETAKLLDAEKYADLGDATLVSSSNIEEVENEIDNNVVESNEIVDNELDDNENTIIDTAVSQIVSIDEYFTQSKLDRDTMYSQMIESYQKILDNSSVSEAQKNIAQEQILKINNTKNAIMIAENLIKNKGFENVIIFVNDNSINVIVKAKDLEQEKIAQIQNIVQRELGADIEDIHISNKE